MEPYLLWVIAAIALVIVELLTGTFYLLVLGLAAAGGAGLAYFAFTFALQAGVATVIAVSGVLIVHRFRAGSAAAAGQGNAIDIGHRVTLDSWTNEAEGLARVRYRGTLWDAKVIGERRAATAFYIRGINGSTLTIEPEA